MRYTDHSATNRVPDQLRFGRRVVRGDFIRTVNSKTLRVNWVCDCGNTGTSGWQTVRNSTYCISCKPRKNGQGFGEENTNWTGGRRTTSSGYIRLYVPEHPHADKRGTVMEHRIVMESLLGRYLLMTERVHHKNGIKNDNSKDNLELWSVKDPPGQRVEDRTEWAIQWLKVYRPEVFHNG